MNEGRSELGQLSFYDFMPRISARVFAPYHFKPIVDIIERAHGGNVRACIAAPRQHGKTTTIKHAFPWLHLRHPKARIFYATYAQEYTEIQSRDIRRLYGACDLQIAGDHNTLKGWTLANGCGDFTASSVDGRANGLGSDICVIDDPFKGPEEAYNKQHRDKVYEWAMQVVMPMLAPKASMLIVASRWDDDDLSGRMIRDQGFDEVRLPAISDEGLALCPDGPNPEQPRNLDFLLEIRDGRMMADGTRRGGIGPYAWSALYQGKPIPRAGSMFTNAAYCDEIPMGARVVAIGCDLATSAGSSSDFSVAVVLAEYAEQYYIVHAERVQQTIMHVETMLNNVRKTYPADLASYVAGQERGILDLLFERGLDIRRLGAVRSKYVRAQKTAIAWGQGKILVPRGAAWLDWFLPEITNFTGNNDAHDDAVDALVSGFDFVEGNKGCAWAAGGFTFGSRCA